MSLIVCNNITKQSVKAMLDKGELIAVNQSKIYRDDKNTIQEIDMIDYCLTPDMVKNIDSLMRLNECKQVMKLESLCITQEEASLVFTPNMDITLNEYINVNNSSNNIMFLFRELIKGLIAMEQVNISHGNIDGNNVLVKLHDRNIVRIGYYNFKHLPLQVNTDYKKNDLKSVINLVKLFVYNNNNKITRCSIIPYIKKILDDDSIYNRTPQDILYMLNEIEQDKNINWYPWNTNNSKLLINTYDYNDWKTQIDKELWDEIVNHCQIMNFSPLSGLLMIDLLYRYYSLGNTRSQYDLLCASRLVALYMEPIVPTYNDYYKKYSKSQNKCDVDNLIRHELIMFTAINCIIYNSNIHTIMITMYSEFKNLQYPEKCLCVKNSYNEDLNQYCTLKY